MEPKFTEQQSLAVIADMIERSKNNLQERAGTMLIYYGYAVAACALANYILTQTLANPYKSFLVWWLMLPLSIIGFFFENRIDRRSVVRTQIDTLINGIWRGFFISVIVLLIIAFSSALFMKTGIVMLIITPVIMMMMALAQFAVAKTYRYKPFYISAITFWIGAMLCSFSFWLFKDMSLQMIILAVSMICGFVIPGYMINSKAKSNV